MGPSTLTIMFHSPQAPGCMPLGLVEVAPSLRMDSYEPSALLICGSPAVLAEAWKREVVITASAHLVVLSAKPFYSGF